VTAAVSIDRLGAKLLVADAIGGVRHLPRTALASLFEPDDLVVANDAATLPASLRGVHHPSGEAVEIRLAAWVRLRDPERFIATAFGAGDYRQRTEDRPQPPRLSEGDRLDLGRLTATVVRTLGHPRLIEIRFAGSRARVVAGLARHGRPVQYAHVPEPLSLRDAWTWIAADPIAFEPPSAGFALDWRTLAGWRERNVNFATLSHAAGLSSTGDSALDQLLPFDEFYSIPGPCASAVREAKRKGRRVIAIGTTVVRALEAAAGTDGRARPGEGIARGRIGRGTRLRVVDAILTGVHKPGESHFDLMKAFANDERLALIGAAAEEHGYYSHEFGDSVLVERGEEPPRR
jgi:S-adenosylmethionine:tRNA ribosyltransferase-isomerase